jgi:hypothetical protein
MKWELDLWYELWDRAGSQGLDTWHDIRGDARDDHSSRRTSDASSGEIPEDGPPEGS